MPGRERDIRLNVRTTSDSKGLQAAARDLDRLAHGVDAAGGNMRDFARDAKALDKQIALTQSRVRDLGTQFAATGDRSLFGDIRKERSFLAEIQKIRKELDDTDGNALALGVGSAAGVRAGRDFTDAFSDAIGALPSKLKGGLILGVVGIGAAIAPALAASVAGAVTGAVGLGGIAGGIAAASKDPRVRAAAHSFGSAISSEFFASGAAFVQPTVDALAILEDAFRDLELGEVFAKAAPYVDDVARGIGGLATEFMPKFERALVAAGPALEVFGEELPGIGEALGDMLVLMAESKGTIDGLRLVLNTVDGTLRLVGLGVSTLSDQFYVLSRSAEFVTGVMEDLPFGGPWEKFNDILNTSTKRAVLFGDQASNAIGKFGEKSLSVAGQVDGLEGQIRDLERSLGNLTGEALSVEEAQDQVSESVARLREQLKLQKDAGDKGAGSLRGNTQAARDNRDAVRELVGKYENLIVKSGASGTAADKLKKRLEDQLVSMGFSRDLAREYAAKLDLVKAKMDAIKSKRVELTLAVTTVTSGRYPKEILALKGKQHGGPVYAGHPVLVGEKRPEVFVPKQDGRIVPKVPAAVGAHAGSTVINLNVHAGLGINPADVGRDIAQALAPYMKKNGGNARIIGIKP